MKILHIGKYYFPFHGGMETVVQSLCEGLHLLGISVEILCSASGLKGSKDEINGIEISRMSRWGILLSQPLTPALFYLARKMAKKVDVVHIHTPNPFAELAALLLPRSVPLVVTYHSDVVRQRWLLPIYGVLLRAFLRRADRIVVATENHITYSKFLPEFRYKCHVIPFAIDDKQFNDFDPSVVQQIKKEHGDFVLFVGRLVGYKGVKYLIKAMVELESNLVIIGDGSLRSELESLADKLGIADRVRFIGPVFSQKSLVAYYHACYVVVLPSISSNENFGMTQLEAMVCSKPMIVTNLKSGVPKVGKKGVSTLIVDPENDHQLACALGILFKNKNLSRKMGEEGYQLFQKRYSLKVMAYSHQKMYQELVPKAVNDREKESEKISA